MELSYLHNCPSCGAGIELVEADRVILCSYCDARNYMAQNEPLRFVLPISSQVESKVDKERFYYIPYLRFKGHIYSCQQSGISHSVIDTTHVGFGSSYLPNSLGLRPQAMKIGLMGQKKSGRCVKITEKIDSIFSKAEKLTSFMRKREGNCHRAFIGETLSYIYLPTYYMGRTLFDGVLQREITDKLPEKLLSDLSISPQMSWKPKYIATHCPDCGAGMSGSRDALVMECLNCDTLWQAQGGAFKKISFSLIGSKKAQLHLPFWKIKVNAIGSGIRSYADFLRITNQPVFLRKEYETMQIYYWIPAFKVRPKYFLHLARNITVSQYKLQPGLNKLTTALHPITLPLSEAIQSLKTVLTSTALNQKKFVSKLSDIEMQHQNSEVVYIPFAKIGHDFVDTEAGVTVSANILRLGRSM